MSLITRVVEEKRSAPISNLTNSQKWLIDLLGGSESKAGIRVNPDMALRVSAVFACVRYIARTIAALPCHLYKRSDRGKDKAIDHPIYALLRQLPNNETTVFDFWLMLLVNHLLCPEAYAYIERDGNGIITALWNIPSNRVTKYRNTVTKELYYGVREEDSGQEKIVRVENMFVLRNMRFSNRDSSLDPIELAREALGLSLALEEFGARYFANGANAGGVVQLQGKLTAEALLRFKETFYEKYAGIANTAKVIFLEDGATYTKTANTPEESQALDSRRHQVVEVARFFGVPLHKILDLTRSTNNNIEHQGIEAVVDCLTPYLVQIEQEIVKDLLRPSERKWYFAKFNVLGLLRGDTAARKDFYVAMIQNGPFCPNDVLELEDMNTFPGGDIHVMNGNVIPVDKVEALADMRIKKGGEINDGTGTPNSTKRN